MKSFIIVAMLTFYAKCYTQSLNNYIKSSHSFLSEIQQPVNQKINLKLNINEKDLTEYINGFYRDVDNNILLDSLGYDFPPPKNRSEIYLALKNNLRFSLDFFKSKILTSSWKWNLNLLNSNYISKIDNNSDLTTIYPPVFIQHSTFVILLQSNSRRTADPDIHSHSEYYSIYKKDGTSYILVTSILKSID